MAEQDLDRSEAATDFKLKKARERGQVAKSAELTGAVVFAVTVVFLYWRGWESLRSQFRFDGQILAMAGRIEPTPAALWNILSHLIQESLHLAAPFLIAIVLAAIVGNLLQTGPLLSFETIKPNWERLSPAKGLKKLFSMRSLYDALRASLKLVLLGCVAFYALKSLVPQFYSLADMSPLGYARALVGDLGSLGVKLALVLGLIAVMDLAYNRHEYAKNMRMSRREIKDEVKQREGDPRIRSRLRALRKEMLKRSTALRKTRTADVLITNPTHVAVALRYVHGEMESPQLVAKGAGVLAAVMRQIAARHHIPVVQNRLLARKIFHGMDFDQHVPPALYPDVARIIVWVFAMRKKQTVNTSSVAGSTTGAY